MCNKHIKHFSCRGCNRGMGTCSSPELWQICPKKCIKTPIKFQTESHEYAKAHYLCMKCTKKEGEKRSAAFREALEKLAVLDLSETSKSTASNTQTKPSELEASTKSVTSSKPTTASSDNSPSKDRLLSKELFFKDGTSMAVVELFWPGLEEYCLTDPRVDYIEYRMSTDNGVVTTRHHYNQVAA